MVELVRVALKNHSLIKTHADEELQRLGAALLRELGATEDDAATETAEDVADIAEKLLERQEPLSDAPDPAASEANGA